MHDRCLVFGVLLLPFISSCYTDQAATVQASMRPVTCYDEGFEIQNLCQDEEEYLTWAQGYQPDRRFADLTGKDLVDIVRMTKDVDKAAALFYQRLITDPTNHAFLTQIRAIEAREARADASKNATGSQTVTAHSSRSDRGAGLMFAVAPGMFYKDNKGEVDATGAALRSIAHDLGMEEQLILTEQTGTVQRNGQIICEFIKHTYEARKVGGLIIASASKGSSDMKMAIQQCGSERFFQIVRGWMNMGGILQGSQLVNYILDHPSAYWKARYYFWRQGYDWEGFLSMRWGAGAPLSAELHVPDHMVVVSIVGVPLFRHVTPRARPFYLALVPQGPSDGIVLLSEAHIPNTITYASFRNDHYFQWPVPEPRIRAFLIYLIDRAKGHALKS